MVSNIAPAMVKAEVAAAERGDWEEARRVHYRLQPLVEACFWESSPIPVKAMLAMLGRVGPTLREPLGPPAPETLKRLRQVLASMKLK